MSAYQQSLMAQQAARLRLAWVAGDLSARVLLLRLSEDAYNRGSFEASAMLFHAEMYLADRRAYELSPPPSKWSIPLQMAIRRVRNRRGCRANSTEETA